MNLQIKSSAKLNLQTDMNRNDRVHLQNVDQTQENAQGREIVLMGVTNQGDSL